MRAIVARAYSGGGNPKKIVRHGGEFFLYSGGVGGSIYHFTVSECVLHKLFRAISSEFHPQILPRVARIGEISSDGSGRNHKQRVFAHGVSLPVDLVISRAVQNEVKHIVHFCARTYARFLFVTPLVTHAYRLQPEIVVAVQKAVENVLFKKRILHA